MRLCANVRRLRGGLSSAAMWLALWAGFAPSSVFPQTIATNAPDSATLLSAAMQELVTHATGGDPKAQCDLGMNYANGNGVPQDFAASVTWFRKAAEQGDANAQLRLGMSFLEGKGTNKDLNEAIKWFYKAAGHVPDKQENPDQTIWRGTIIKKLVTLDGETFNNARVEKVEPDGISITYESEKGGLGMAKPKFSNLPGDVRKACGYDPQAEAAFFIQQSAMEELRCAEEARRSAESNTRKSELVATLTKIVSTYHKTHKYLTNDTGNYIYVCGDMACDVWDMVFSEGIHAKILAGNVNEDITSIAQANHAWVLAEISDGDWLALETTGGYAVRFNENKRYFFGCRFSTPKDYRDFEHLKRQYNEALSKGRAAEDAYNSLVTEYNGADKNDKVSLKVQLQQRLDVLKERTSDLKQLKAEMDTFHLTEE
jgi:hypothetical protein